MEAQRGQVTHPGSQASTQKSWYFGELHYRVWNQCGRGYTDAHRTYFLFLQGPLPNYISQAPFQWDGQSSPLECEQK